MTSEDVDRTDLIPNKDPGATGIRELDLVIGILLVVFSIAIIAG
jgi:hypothetical protein